MKIIEVVCFSALLLSSASNVSAFTLFLDNGTFFGPGNAVYNDTGIVGKNTFVDAQVRNIVLTGPLNGFIPFFNNGAEEPNVIAEKLQQGGVIDGMASDGTLINENADTALRLNFSDPETGESADVMVIAEFSNATPDGGEPILPDANGNLTFSPSVLADPGSPELISRFEVSFTTGVAQVPFSLKTQQGLGEGEDNAGPLPSGHALVGRMGDFDQDGYLDGILVLAANAPLDLVVARGNPIAQIRPWISDIPVDPITASVLTLNGVVRNYAPVLEKTLERNDISAAINYLNSVTENTKSVLNNMRIVLLSGQLDSSSKKNIERLRRKLRHAHHYFIFAIELFENIESRKHKSHGRGEHRISMAAKEIRMSFEKSDHVLQELAILSGINS